MPQLSRSAGFRDRRQAGRLLALELVRRELTHGPNGPVVVGLARGGVEVAAEVAAVLHAPLDALAVRKVGHPLQPEYGIGAVAPGGVVYMRAPDDLTEAEVARAVRVAEAKAAALDAKLHRLSAALGIFGATCILVDDGLATGGTMAAAARWARVHGAGRIVVAVPVGSADTVRWLAANRDVDSVVCLVVPPDLGAVGFWYEDFTQVSDQEVARMLATSHGNFRTASHTDIALDGVRLEADIRVPQAAVGLVVFAHGSGSSRRSARNLAVASTFNRAGIGTLLFDLLTEDEARDRENVFDIRLLAERLVAATRWLSTRPEARGLPLAYFGASTGAAAALLAAAELGDRISAVVSRGGRPDLAWVALPEVSAPVLLIVGGADRVVLELNEAAASRLTCSHELVVVPQATHLFEEHGALEEVASLATAWLEEHFAPATDQPESDDGGGNDGRHRAYSAGLERAGAS